MVSRFYRVFRGKLRPNSRHQFSLSLGAFFRCTVQVSPQVYRTKGSAKAEPKVVQLFLHMFYFGQETILTLSKSRYYGDFFFWKMFYPPKGAAKAEPKVVQLFLLMFYCVREGCLTLSKHASRRGLFEILKMFYPPKGLRKQNRRWSNCFY